MKCILAVLTSLLLACGVVHGADEAPPARAEERTADQAFAAVEATRLQATAQPLPESEVFVQSGHRNKIVRLAWSPDDSFIATAGDDTMKLWDMATGRLVYTYSGHGSLVNAVAFTPDGEWLVTAGAQPDNSLHVIERRSGRMLHRLAGHTSGVQDFTFLSGGRQLLSVADDGGQAILWDLATAKLLRQFSFEGLGNLRSVAMLPSGDQAVLGSYGGHLGLVSLTDGRVLRTYPKQEREIARIVVHPDGRSFFTAVGGWIGEDAGGGALIRWSLDSEAVLERYDGPGGNANIWALALSPDGGMVAAGSGNSRLGFFQGFPNNLAAEDAVWLWRADSGAQLAKWPFGKEWSVNSITDLAFSHDGRRLAYADGDTRSLAVRALDADAAAQVFGGRRTTTLHLAVESGGSAWSAESINDKYLAASRRARGDLKSPAPQRGIPDGVRRVMRWDLRSGDRADVVDAHAWPIQLLVPTSEGVLSFSRNAALGSENGLTIVATGETREADRTDFTSRLGWGMLAEDPVAISRSGRKLALAHSYSAPGAVTPAFFVSLYEQEAKAWRLVKTLPVENPVTALAFSADEDGLLAGVCEVRDRTGQNCNKVNGVRLHCADLTKGEWVAASSHVTQRIDEIRVSPDGAFALSTGAHAIGWRTDTCQGVRALWAGDGRFTSAGAWSPDQQRIAVASAGRRIRLWDADKVHIERVLEGFDGRVVGLAFTPDSKTLLALSDNGAMRVWNTESGKLRATMIEFEDGEWITITPEGYFMGSPEADRQLNVRHGDRVYGMDQFYDVFYRPDIVRRKLAGEKIDDLIRVTLDDAVRQPPPHVTVSAQPDADGRIRLLLDASDEGGGVGVLRVYHNGKLIAADDAPRLEPPGQAPSPTRQDAQAVRRMLAGGAKRAPLRPLAARLREVEMTLAPGDNRVWVTAFNADGTLQTRPVAVALPRLPEAVPRVFVLALGVNRYRNAKDIPTLRYAVKDAQTFGGEIRRRMAGTFPGQTIDFRLLTDEGATLAAVDRELERLRKEMRPGDVFVWFIASHGMLDDDSMYNVVLHDADLDRPGRGVLPASRLVDWLKRLPALNQMVVLDTCHAGGLDGTVRGLYDSRLGVLARSMGLHVLASASATEEAIDGYQGSGLFTHSMLRAMDDPASDSNRDRRLSATELGRYARDLTQSIARGMRFGQTPLSFHYGRDMVITTFP